MKVERDLSSEKGWPAFVGAEQFDVIIADIPYWDGTGYAVASEANEAERAESNRDFRLSLCRRC